MKNADYGEGKQGDFWQALFAADSIAVIGARDTEYSWGFDALKAALVATEANPNKQVYAVNPHKRQVLGLTSYTNILNVPKPVDLAIIVVPVAAVPGVLRQCVQKKVKAAVIITAGFSEIGGEGTKLEAEVVKIAREGGLRFVGPNCVGHTNTHTRISSANFVSRVMPGAMSLLSQSGMLSASIIQMAYSRGIGLSKFVGTGNEADLHFEDYLEYLAGDDDTRIITAYIEGLREGRRFFQLAKEITAKKPIVVIKTGTTSGSSQAAKSHTGALAGSDTVYTAAFKQSGVLRAEDEEELCDLVMALVSQPLPRGNRVGILTVGGGIGVLTAEACEKEGLIIAPLDPPTLDKLNAILPPLWSQSNPVDLVNIRSMPRHETFSKCLAILMESENIDGIIGIMPPMAALMHLTGNLGPEQVMDIRTERDQIMNLLTQRVKQYGKPLFLVRRFTPQLNDGDAAFSSPPEDRIPEFSHPRRAAKTIRLLSWYHRYLADSKA